MAAFLAAEQMAGQSVSESEIEAAMQEAQAKQASMNNNHRPSNKGKHKSVIHLIANISVNSHHRQYRPLKEHKHNQSSVSSYWPSHKSKH